MCILIYIYIGRLKIFYNFFFYFVCGVHAFPGPREEVRGQCVGVSLLPLCEFLGLNSDPLLSHKYLYPLSPYTDS